MFPNTGYRAPELRPGFEAQYEALLLEEMIWDSSVSTLQIEKPVWPYTLDHKIPHKCKIDSCPVKAYPGMWEIPLNSHYVSDSTGGQCSYLDQCVFSYLTGDDVFEWLKEDFYRYYNVSQLSSNIG